MKVTIPYGHSELEFDVPDDHLEGVYSPNQVETAEDPRAEIARAIDHPIGSPHLRQLIAPGCKICVICDDITRPTPVYAILEVLLPKLLEYGATAQHVKIVMALGSHRYMTKEEMIEKIGRYAYDHFTVLNSEFKQKEKLVHLGKAHDGTEIWANRDVMESDVRIGIGNIVPHPAVGWSGGGKIIYPGVTGEDTVAKFHIQHGLVKANMFGMDDSPVRLNMEKWVDTVGLHFIINTVMTPDKQLVKVVAGHYVEAQREGVRYSKRVYGKQVGQKAEIAVVSAFPADMDFWQATKGVLSGDHIVADGGTLILVSPCWEGIGPHRDYMEHIGNDDADELLLRVANGEAFNGSAVALAAAATISRIRRRIRLALVAPTIQAEEASRGKFNLYRSVQEAVDQTIKSYDSPKLSVITHGGELFLYV